MGTSHSFSETQRHGPAPARHGAQGATTAGSSPSLHAPAPQLGRTPPKGVTTELVFREAQEPSWERGAGSPNYRFLRSLCYLLKSTTGTFSQLRTVDAGHSRKGKKYQVSVTALRQTLHVHRGDDGDAGAAPAGGAGALTARWPGRRSPGSRCPFCSGPSSAPAWPGWASVLPQPGLSHT